LGDEVLPRKNVVRGVTDKNFLELITKKNLATRNSQRMAIHLVKRIAPERVCSAIRRLLVR